MDLNKNQDLLSDKDLKSLIRIMHNKYGSFIGARSFDIKITSCDASAFCVCVSLSNNDLSFYYPVHGKIMFDTDPDLRLEAAFLLIDFIDIYFGEYFNSDEQVLIPIDWTEHKFEGYTLFVKGQIFNKKIENMTDEFLSSHAHVNNKHKNHLEKKFDSDLMGSDHKITLNNINAQEI